MRLLVCGDLHLKPQGSGYDLTALDVPPAVDAIIILGDLTHRANQADIELARKVVERLASQAPVVYVPGNHDPAPMDATVVDDITDAGSGHDRALQLGELTIVGRGCEQRSLSQAIDLTAFPSLDPRDVPPSDRQFEADRVADRLMDACYELVVNGTSVTTVADSLGIEPERRSDFKRGIDDIRETYLEFEELLEGEDEVLLATHVPPYGTSFDRHHAKGTREVDLEKLHFGSIAQRLALREYDVFAALSGHSHSVGYDVGESSDGRPHLLNLGFRGLGIVQIDPASGLFSYQQIKTGG